MISDCIECMLERVTEVISVSINLHFGFTFSAIQRNLYCSNFEKQTFIIFGLLLVVIHLNLLVKK